MKKIVISLFLILAVILGNLTAFAYSIKYSGGFSPKPAYVTGYSGFETATHQAIHNACVTWNGAGKGDLVYRNTYTHTNTSFPSINNANEITKVNQGTSVPLMSTAWVTQAFIGLKLACLEADININVAHPFGDGSTNPNVYDVQSGITHEIGHLLGLNHSTTSGATMYESYDKGEIWMRTLEQDDKNGIAAIY